MRRIKTLLILALVALPLLLPGQVLGVEDWFEQGLSFISSQNYEEAIKAFSKAIEANPRDGNSYNNRGVAWHCKGNYERAIADYTKALEINPRHYKAFNNRGSAWFSKGDYHLAIADCTKALEVNPSNADAYNQLAWILAVCPDERYRNGTKALELAKKALELKQQISFLDTLAAAYAESGKFEDAITTQERVISMLKKEGKAGELPEYVERLKSYKDNIPWKVKDQSARQKTAEDASTSTVAKAEEVMPQPSSRRDLLPTGKGPYPYTIQISSNQEMEKSKLIAMKLQKKGDPAFTSYAHIPGKGEWYRIFIGFFGTPEEAQQAAQKLKKRKFRYADVVKKPYAIQLGLYDEGQKLGTLETDLQRHGYVAYKIPDPQYRGKIRLLIGAFKTEKEAAKEKVKLEQEGFEPIVVLR